MKLHRPEFLAHRATVPGERSPARPASRSARARPPASFRLGRRTGTPTTAPGSAGRSASAPPSPDPRPPDPRPPASVLIALVGSVSVADELRRGLGAGWDVVDGSVGHVLPALVVVRASGVDAPHRVTDCQDRYPQVPLLVAATTPLHPTEVVQLYQLGVDHVLSVPPTSFLAAQVQAVARRRVPGRSLP